MTIYINGKFTCQHLTGVQRTALGLLLALDDWLASQDPAQRAQAWVLLCPLGAQVPPLRHIRVRRFGLPGLPLGAWEQLLLPLLALGGRLLNLAGSAPALAWRQSCMLHDAAVFDRPQAYTWLFRSWYQWLFARLAQRAQHLFTVSWFSSERLRAVLQLPEGRLQVVPNGGDHLARVVPELAVLERFGLGAVPYVLMVGSANPNKNTELVERVFRALPAATTQPPNLPSPGRPPGGDEDTWGGPACPHEMRLVVVGGLNHRVFASTADPQAFGDSRIVRVGCISDPALKALYLHAELLVFPSLYEGFGLPALEAMACGCPVLAAEAGAIPEVCGDAALYFDPQSADDLNRKLGWALSDRSLRQRLRVRGQARATLFRWRDAALQVHAAMVGQDPLAYPTTRMPGWQPTQPGQPEPGHAAQALLQRFQTRAVPVAASSTPPSAPAAPAADTSPERRPKPAATW